VSIATEFRAVWGAIKSYLNDSKRTFIFLLLFILIAMVLQWLFQYEQLWLIITNEGLNFGEKIQQIFRAFVNLFVLIDDLTPIAILSISFLQSMALSMLISSRYLKETNKSSSIVSSGMALFGSGCVACGGSVLSPLLSAIASNLSVATVNVLGDIVLLVAIVLSYRALSKVALQYASFFK